MNHGRLSRVIITLAVGLSATAHAKDFPSIAGEYLIKLKPTNSIMSTVRLENSIGAKIKEQINKNERIYLVQRPMVELRSNAIAAMAHNPLIELVEPNYIYRAVGGSTSLPNDPLLGRLWGLNNTGEDVDGDFGKVKGKAGFDINALKAWEIETGSREVVVAVIDTGVNYNHEDLVANIYTNEAELTGQVGVDDDANGCVDDIHGCDFANSDSDPMDVYGHGTHCSGTIGAVGNNGNGIIGVAWNVRILPVRFLGDDGSGSLANAVKSIDYATAMKVNIMSNSWGGGGFSQLLMDAIARAKDANILFVAAAGNSSADLDAAPEYPAGYQVDNVLAVAAVDAAGMVSDFSNFGRTTVHIAAPGVNVWSYTMKGTEAWSGTSMACPHVSGAAALLLSQDITQSYATIKQRLMSSARPTSNLRGRVVTGMLDAYYALTNTVAPLDPTDPFNWQKTQESISTAHPYVDNFKQEYTLTVPGAQRVSVFFSRFETEGNYDKVVFKNAAGQEIGSLSGKLGEVYSPVIEGDTVTLSFSSDASINFYGFDIGGIAYQ